MDTNPIFTLRLMGYTQELIVACRLLAEFLLLDNLSLSCMVKRECNGVLTKWCPLPHDSKLENEVIISFRLDVVSLKKL